VARKRTLKKKTNIKGKSKKKTLGFTKLNTAVCSHAQRNEYGHFSHYVTAAAVDQKLSTSVEWRVNKGGGGKLDIHTAVRSLAARFLSC
jgi:hypothetical protein